LYYGLTASPWVYWSCGEVKVPNDHKVRTHNVVLCENDQVAAWAAIFDLLHSLAAPICVY